MITSSMQNKDLKIDINYFSNLKIIELLIFKYLRHEI